MFDFYTSYPVYKDKRIKSMDGEPRKRMNTERRKSMDEESKLIQNPTSDYTVSSNQEKVKKI